MIVRVDEQDIWTKVKFHLKYKIPYTLEIKGTRHIFKSRRGEYMSMSSEFPAKELSFIKSVKENVIKNQLYLEIPNKFKSERSKNKIKHYSYSKKYKSGNFISNVVEIDLKRAYWDIANNMNILDNEIYLKGKEEVVSKQSRLAAIGSFAIKSRILGFDGEKETNSGIIRSKLTEFIWDTISYRIGKIMKQAEVIAGNEFIFFWVDAIFVKKGSEKKIVKLFSDLGFSSSIYHCEWVKIKENKIYVHSEEHKKKDKDNLIRPFPLNTSRVKGKIKKENERIRQEYREQIRLQSEKKNNQSN
jgi:hypothetical protein